MKFLKNKKILIIITGGIAAYKTLDLIRKLSKHNCEIKTVLTKSGKEFVTPLSITSLSKNKANQALNYLASGQIPHNSNSYSELNVKKLEMKTFRNQSIIGLLLLVILGVLVF